MKKLWIVLLAFGMLVTLCGCSSGNKEEEIAEENNRPIKTVSFFGKDYSTPVSLAEIKADGVEVLPVFIDGVSGNDTCNVFLSKDGEYIQVYVYNPGSERKSVTDDSLMIRRIMLQYKDMYSNAADIPSCKIEGAGIGDKVDILDAIYGEPTDGGQLDPALLGKYWALEYEGENCTLDVTFIGSDLYSIDARIPTK